MWDGYKGAENSDKLPAVAGRCMSSTWGNLRVMHSGAFVPSLVCWFFLKNTEKNKVYSYLTKEMPFITLDDRL